MANGGNLERDSCPGRKRCGVASTRRCTTRCSAPSSPKYTPLFTEGSIHTRVGPGPVGPASLKSLRNDGTNQVLDVKFTDDTQKGTARMTTGVDRSRSNTY